MDRKRRGFSLLALSCMITGALVGVATPAWTAAPVSFGASIGAATVTPDPVLRSSGAVTISATVTGTYSADESPSAETVGTWTSTSGVGTCSKGANTYAMNEMATVTRTVVTYVDKGLIVDGVAMGITATATDPVDLTGRADGTNSATLTTAVQATQTKRTTTQTVTYYRYWDGTREQCRVENANWATSGTPVDLPMVSSISPVELSASDSFFLDLVAPTVTASLSGGATTAPTGGAINANISVSNGTPGDGFTLVLKAYHRNDDGSYEATPFATGSGPGTIGNNGTESFPSVGLEIPCSAPLGASKLVAVLQDLTDRGDSDFDDVVVNVANFTVLSSVNLVGATTVFGWTDLDGDGIADYTNMDAGFSAVVGGKVVNTNPGAFWLTGQLKTTGQCNDKTLMNFRSGGSSDTPDITLKAPAGFQFVITGKLYTRVYAGDIVTGTLFNAERPNLVGVSATGDVTTILKTFESVNSSTNPTEVKVRLGQLTYWQDTSDNGIYGDTGDTLKTGGALPADWTVFVKVRLRWVGTTLPVLGNPGYSFDGTYSVDGYNGVLVGDTKVNSYILFRTA